MDREEALDSVMENVANQNLVKHMLAAEAVMKALAILPHNQAHGILPQTMLDKALICADPLTGLITATALVRPDKKLDGVQASSVKKRFKESRFAAGVNREQIAACSAMLGIGLDEFIEIGLGAMQDIAAELGL